LRNGDLLTFGQTQLNFYSPSAQKDDASTSNDSADYNVTATLHVRRLISVMVVDIRNFTGLTQQMDDALLSAMIGTWFRHAGEIMRTEGSWVDKYIGDALPNCSRSSVPSTNYTR